MMTTAKDFIEYYPDGDEEYLCNEDTCYDSNEVIYVPPFD